MKAPNLPDTEQIGINLYMDICQIIEKTRGRMSSSVNMELTLMYWNIGDRINRDVLGFERAAYGKHIVATLSRQLTEEYGAGFDEVSKRHIKDRWSYTYGGWTVMKGRKAKSRQ